MQLQFQAQFLQQQQEALFLSVVLAQQREAAALALKRFAVAAEIHAAADVPPSGAETAATGSLPKVPVAPSSATQQDGTLQEQTTMDPPLPSTPESGEVSVGGPRLEGGCALEGTEHAATRDARRFLGTIKSYNTLQGFGFIQSLEVRKLYGCDVFLNQHVEGGVVVGGLVSFSVEVNGGRPQARQVVLQERKAPVDLNIAGVGRTYIGRVKSYNAARGFGFITCPELPQPFCGQDVYVAKSHVLGIDLSVGREIEFRLMLDRQGHPQAHDVTSLWQAQAR
jgi:cold shock CspA family protein